MRLEKLENYEISTEEMRSLLGVAEATGEAQESLVKALTLGSATAWRISAQKASGIMVTTNNDDTLFIWYLAGKGIWRYRLRFVDELKDLAVKQGLRGITATIIPELARTAERTGFRVKTFIEWRI